MSESTGTDIPAPKQAVDAVNMLYGVKAILEVAREIAHETDWSKLSGAGLDAALQRLTGPLYVAAATIDQECEWIEEHLELAAVPQVLRA